MKYLGTRARRDRKRQVPAQEGARQRPRTEVVQLWIPDTMAIWRDGVAQSYKWNVSYRWTHDAHRCRTSAHADVKECKGDTDCNHFFGAGRETWSADIQNSVGELKLGGKVEDCPENTVSKLQRGRTVGY